VREIYWELGNGVMAITEPELKRGIATRQLVTEKKKENHHARAHSLANANATNYNHEIRNNSFTILKF
jgi:hypothetical protein